MSGERSLLTLNLKLGCGLDDVKKAYKVKALQFHPDRNPGSTTAGDNFKLVHQAYEYLMQNPSALTTPSFTRNTRTAPPTTGGYGSTTSTGGTATTKPSTPLFTEAELFGGMNDFGDFGTKKKPTGGSKGTTTSGSRAQSFSGFRQSKKEPGLGSTTEPGSPPRPPPRKAESFSGYDNFEEDNLDKMFADRRKSREENLGKSDHVPLSAYTPSDTANEAHARHEVLEKLRKSNAYYRTGNLPPRSSPEREGSQKAKRREFQEAREEAQAKLDAAASMEKMDREERKRKIDQETKEEWDAYMSKMEDDTIKKNVKSALKRAEAYSQEESKADALLRDVSADRRKTRAEGYSRGMPSTTAIGTMPEGDLHLLVGILSERLQFAQQCLRHKSSGPCAMCHTSARAGGPSYSYSCTHRATCELCYETAVECPICGAVKK